MGSAGQTGNQSVPSRDRACLPFLSQSSHAINPQNAQEVVKWQAKPFSSQTGNIRQGASKGRNVPAAEAHCEV